ncbi:MAG: hypothetical protein PVH88_01975 [Ignavibacteria bacterium]|jgi:hypothetical protein
MIEQIEYLQSFGIYISVYPEFSPVTNTFMGWTYCVTPEYADEFIGNCVKTYGEAFSYAVDIGVKFAAELERKKILSKELNLFE